MKILRRILFWTAATLVIIVSAGFFLPKKVYVERSLIIDSSPKRIFYQVNTINRWVKWSPWLQADSTIQVSFTGTESGNGACLSWLSKDANVGNGSITVIESNPEESIYLLFDYGEKGSSAGKFIFEKTAQGTKVTWSIESNLGKNPFSRWIGLFSDNLIGPDLEKGLMNLDESVNHNNSIYGFEIIDCELTPGVYLSVRDTASYGTVSAKMTLMFNKISGFLKSRNLSPTGPPFTVFHSHSIPYFDIEAGMPVSTRADTKNGINCYSLDYRKALMVKYFGSRKQVSKAYIALESFIKENGLLVAGSPWEEYITNPSIEPDTAKWQTNIYFPVK